MSKFHRSIFSMVPLLAVLGMAPTTVNSGCMTCFIELGQDTSIRCKEIKESGAAACELTVYASGRKTCRNIGYCEYVTIPGTGPPTTQVAQN